VTVTAAAAVKLLLASLAYRLLVMIMLIIMSIIAFMGFVVVVVVAAAAVNSTITCLYNDGCAKTKQTCKLQSFVSVVPGQSATPGPEGAISMVR
jgi:hypothetical protein